ncbi:MAG: hypothetical protein FJ009_03265 [Chloroflexi bacterium]|nr:hypothetical protein [Chloroflexota bacterium]
MSRDDALTAIAVCSFAEPNGRANSEPDGSARHRRRQNVQCLAVGGFCIQEHRAAGEFIQHVARGGII